MFLPETKRTETIRFCGLTVSKEAPCHRMETQESEFTAGKSADP